MKPRIDRLSTTRPKKPLRSPGTNQRGCLFVIHLIRYRTACFSPSPSKGRSGWGWGCRDRKENPSPPKPSPRRGGLQGSALSGEIHADRARFVDGTGKVVDVDARSEERCVGKEVDRQFRFR